MYKGFTYDGLDAAQARLLDQFGGYLGSIECLGAELDAQHHSGRGFVPMTVVSELLRRVGHVRFAPVRLLKNVLGRQQRHTPVRYLPLLETGRRNRTVADPIPRTSELPLYVVFSPDEVMELRTEVLVAIRAPIPWEHPDEDPAFTEDCMLAPLTRVMHSGRWLLMTYG